MGAARSMLRDPACFLALGAGSGLAPRAPGTCGTLAAVPLVLWLQTLPPAGYAAALAVMTVAGVGLCARAAAKLRRHDHPAIVWDEITGFALTMFALPTGWGWLAAGFVLFRIFDIVKPWPIARVDARVRGGVGIMGDDLLAGLYANLVLQGCQRLLG